MIRTLVQQVRAAHDASGNPRRAWLVYSPSGELVAVLDEGYAGSRVLLDVLGVAEYRDRIELESIDVSAGEYRRLIGRGALLRGTAVPTSDQAPESELELRAAYGDK